MYKDPWLAWVKVFVRRRYASRIEHLLRRGKIKDRDRVMEMFSLRYDEIIKYSICRKIDVHVNVADVLHKYSIPPQPLYVLERGSTLSDKYGELEVEKICDACDGFGSIIMVVGDLRKLLGLIVDAEMSDPLFYTPFCR